MMDSSSRIILSGKSKKTSVPIKHLFPIIKFLNGVLLFSKLSIIMESLKLTGLTILSHYFFKILEINTLSVFRL